MAGHIPETASAILTVNVVDHLVSHAAVVLQDVILLGTSCDGNLLGDGEQLGQVLVWDVVQLSAMVLGDDEGMAFRDGSDVCRPTTKRRSKTASAWHSIYAAEALNEQMLTKESVRLVRVV